MVCHTLPPLATHAKQASHALDTLFLFLPVMPADDSVGLLSIPGRLLSRVTSFVPDGAPACACALARRCHPGA